MPHIISIYFFIYFFNATYCIQIICLSAIKRIDPEGVNLIQPLGQVRVDLISPQREVFVQDHLREFSSGIDRLSFQKGSLFYKRLPIGQGC